jgi:hypothetical protein
VNNYEIFFVSFLIPILMAIVIDYVVLRKIRKEELNDNTDAEKL